jgi:ectoine hydroxylase-related dioxygenase (phytanoyl-CoA dioxygenase family)
MPQEATIPMSALTPARPELAARPYPPAAAPRSPYHLSPEQVRFFDDNGYLILRQWIPPQLLERVQAAGDAWIERGLRDSPDDPNHADFGWKKGPNGRTFYAVGYVHNMGQPASLELLGSPQVLAVVESLTGPNFVPTYESMVFKMTGQGAPIHWHQDAVHPRRYRIFNYDLYLDASRTGAGALKVVPRSQMAKVDVCDFDDNHGWNPPGAIEVEMAPGDVLLHDVMVVHGSEPVVGKALRRTLYYEFRAAEEVLEDGPWDRNWIDRRLRLIPLALRRHQEAFPEAAQFDWRIAGEFRPAPGADEAEELRVAHVVNMPGSYCSAGDAGTGKRMLVD